MSIRMRGRLLPQGKFKMKQLAPPVLPLAFTSVPTITGTRVGDQYKVNWATNRTPTTVSYEWLTGGVAAKTALNKDTYWPVTATNIQCRVTATIGNETVRYTSAVKTSLGQSGNMAFADGFETQSNWAPNYGLVSYVTGGLVLEGSSMLRMDPVTSGNPSDISSVTFNSRSGGNNYRIRVWARGLNGPSRLRVLLYTNGTYVVNNYADLTSEWKPYDFAFTTSGAMQIRLISENMSTPTILVDSVSVYQI